MLPCGREQCFVKVYAADCNASVRITHRREYNITDAGAVIGECRGQIGREFLEHSLSIASHDFHTDP